MLRLPDLDFAKRGVLDMRGSPESIRAYSFAFDDFIGHVSVETTERYLGCKQRLHRRVNDNIGLES